MEYLELNTDSVSTQIISRDRHALLLNELALIGCSLEKFATQIRLSGRAEIKEISEGFSRGQKGSSAMAWKKNPVKCENICGISRLLRSYSQAAMENVALWECRDISQSSVERIVFPDAFGLLYYSLKGMNSILNNLVLQQLLVQGNNRSIL
jgi:adenylosuccinate lyase